MSDREPQWPEVTGLLPSGRAPTPMIMFLELTRRCNGHCIMCGTSAKNNVAPLDMPLSAAQQLAAMHATGIRRLELRGRGESTLYPGLEELLSHIARWPVRPIISLTTNGQYLTPTMTSLLTGISASVSFSVDGATRTVFEKIRRGLSFRRVINNIRRYLDECSDSRTVSLVCTVQRDNLSTVADIVTLAADLGVSTLLLHDVEPCESALHPGARPLAEAYERAVTTAEAVGVGLAMPRRYTSECSMCVSSGGRMVCQEAMYHPGVFPDPGITHYERCSRAKPCVLAGIPIGCTAPWTTAFIAADGTLSLCCKAAAPCGNVLQTDVTSIWQGPAAATVRQRLRDRIPSKACATCMYCWDNTGVADRGVDVAEVATASRKGREQ